MLFEQIPEVWRDVLMRGLVIVAALAGLWILRYIVIWILTRPLVRLAERVGSPQLDDRLRDIVTTPIQFVFYAAVLLVLGSLVDIDETAQLIIARLARTLIIVAVALAIYRALAIVGFSRARLMKLTGVSVEESLLPFIRVGLQFLVLAFVVVIIVQEWGYDVSALVAGLGLGGLAFSLAAQDTIANLFGFSTIVGDRPFVVGDFIKTPDVEGTVERVGLRSTRVRQINQALVTVPNKTLANSVILNWSRVVNKRLFDLTLHIPTSERPQDVEHVLANIRAMLESREPVDPTTVIVYFTKISDLWFEVLIRCSIMIADWKVFAAEQEAINLEIVRIMRETLGSGGVLATVAVPTTTPLVDKETT